jgi:hypothetical protein
MNTNEQKSESLSPEQLARLQRLNGRKPPKRGHAAAGSRVVATASSTAMMAALVGTMLTSPASADTQTQAAAQPTPVTSPPQAQSDNSGIVLYLTPDGRIIGVQPGATPPQQQGQLGTSTQSPIQPVPQSRTHGSG